MVTFICYKYYIWETSGTKMNRQLYTQSFSISVNVAQLLSNGCVQQPLISRYHSDAILLLEEL